ncbi:MAG: hypothetical protein H0T92_09835 [Pyrinomonadaceae bacterium]|nr:hypothetical protein [Pyrinomonadaceae bacterium]
MSGICVAHLVREQNGLAPFKAFLNSYRERPAGVGHDLLLIFKGFAQQHVLDEYRSQLAGLSYKSFLVPDHGFDVRPYFLAARRFDYQYFCFLNSYSLLLDESWLAKMHKYITHEEVGIVGATGSYESHYSNIVHTIFVESGELLEDVWQLFHKRVVININRMYFPPFPNPHIRTNAFMLSRKVMLKLKVGRIKNKMDAHRFESGKSSLTRQILDMNLKALVVGRDGRAYDKDEWFESNTFRRADQSNLLISDNQTREYLLSDSHRKRVLSKDTWGNRPSHVDWPSGGSYVHR